MTFGGKNGIFSALKAAALLAGLAGGYAAYCRLRDYSDECEAALTAAERAAAAAARPGAATLRDLGSAIARWEEAAPEGSAAVRDARAAFYALRVSVSVRGAPDAAAARTAAAIATGAAGRVQRGLGTAMAWTGAATAGLLALLLAAELLHFSLLSAPFLRGFSLLKEKLLRSAAPFYPSGEGRGELQELCMAADALDITLENSMLARIRLARETGLRQARMKAQTRTLELTRRKVITLIEDLEETRAELQREKKALKEAGDKLARSNRDLEQFAYVASHDLREPLRVISSFSGLLSKRYSQSLDGDGREFIGYIDAGARRASDLVGALFNYSRITYTHGDFGPVNCGEALKKAMFSLKLAIEDRKAEISAGPLPEVTGDEDQLVQLFQNLLSNALKFNSSAAPRISVTAEEAAGETVITFRDNGIGIPREHFDRIFLIFQRLHTPDKYPGTGIGLALCKKIAENHGGRIWVESEPGAGSAFRVALPAGTPAGTAGGKAA